MPRYEYHCEACNRKVTLRLSVTQHEKARQACPKCGSKKLTQLIIEMCVSNRHSQPRAILSGHATTGKSRGAGTAATARD
jgi:putative FmdB family regulatory protein